MIPRPPRPTPDPPGDPASAGGSPPPPEQDPVDILLVDDRPENLLALEAILAAPALNLVKAHSGPEALKRLLARDFALILLDVQMPGMDGFETAELIRQRDRSRHTPIIFVTAYDRSEAAVARGYRVGAVDFLFKPIVPEILKGKVTVFVDLFRKTEQVKRQVEQIRQAEQREAQQRLAAERQQWEAARLREEIDREKSRVEELERLQDELRRAKAEADARKDDAEAASRAKSQFLANMSHELRTPLNAVIMYAELLQEEAHDRAIDGFIPDLDRIRTAGRHLLALVNGVLDLSKIEAGKMDLYLETFDVAQMVQDVLTTVQPLAQKKDNRLELSGPPDLGPMHADLTKVRQILFNLLSNACKFTEHGTVTLAVERQQGGPAGDQLLFRVSDTGIGISPDEIARLFQPFTQADASTTRRFGGTGLGLAISKRFCEIMGGDLAASGSPGAGTTFTLRLPARLAPAAPPQPGVVRASSDDSAATAAAAGKPLVLVIDDDASVHDLMSRALAPEGVRIVTAPDGETGLRLARDLDPVLIFLDVLMPKVDGWAVLTALKADPALAHIPVVMLTIVSDREMGYLLGASEYLTKPVDRDRLAAVLRQYVPTGVGGDDACHVLVVEDDEPTRDVLRRALARHGCQVAEAANGRAALDRLRDRRPDLILLDLMMPEMDGFEFLAELRSSPDWAPIPVVVLTSKDLTPADHARLSGLVERILAKGAYTRDTLLREVRKLVAHYTARPDAGVPAPVGTTTPQGETVR